jgi:Mitochondrial carrier protein
MLSRSLLLTLAVLCLLYVLGESAKSPLGRLARRQLNTRRGKDQRDEEVDVAVEVSGDRQDHQEQQAIHNACKLIALRGGNNDVDWRYFVAGGICAATSHGITTPLDVIKTKMQTNPEVQSDCMIPWLHGASAQSL